MAPAGRRLFAFDRALGRALVAGADEAGRGSLAGPLVAAAVLFDYRRLTAEQEALLAALDDSKQHRQPAREGLYAEILLSARRIAVVSRSAPTIDAAGLHVCNLEALREALERATCGLAEPALCLIDGFSLPALGGEQRAIPGGDGRSAAIAAASIVAKVTRDRYMQQIGSHFPEWKLQENVGYSTPEHRAAIIEHGITPLHRRSFRSAAYERLAS